jgi:hypothetical protein
MTDSPHSAVDGTDLESVDTSRPEDAPDLRPLPDEPPEAPTKHGWEAGTRDWYWSTVRRELTVMTGGASTFNDQGYPLGISVSELVGARARILQCGLPPKECRAWVHAGLKASCFRFSDSGEILFFGPNDLPPSLVEKALSFAVRRADRALKLWAPEGGREALPDPPHIVGGAGPEETPEAPPEDGQEEAAEEGSGSRSEEAEEEAGKTPGEDPGPERGPEEPQEEEPREDPGTPPDAGGAQKSLF